MKLFRSLVLISIILVILIVPASFASKRTGAVVKIPFPIVGENISLESQKVKIIVFSTFIEVFAEYRVKNNNKEDITATIGFPVNLHSVDTSKGESPILGISALKRKKDEDYFVKREIDGNASLDADRPYRIWYKWDMDIRKGGAEIVKLHYYVKMDRKDGIPNFTYEIKPAKRYVGTIAKTNIEINMPIDCKNLPFTSKKIYKKSSYVYTSFPRPKIQKNILRWQIADMEPREDLEVYFYGKDFPGWKVTCSSANTAEGHGSDKVLDGNPRTFWLNNTVKNEGSWLEFTPFIFGNEKVGDYIAPKIYKIAIIPGNGETLSKFYQYPHLREAIVLIRKKADDDGEKKSEEDEKKLRRRRETRFIEVSCTADWTLQSFEAKKEPLDTTKGPARMKIKSIYPGQKYKSLCISEVLIFDRKDNELYGE
ncbi:MAG: hypothetical protein K8T10_11500 [Candidatus Eremiobacteraeota bacterium]|nr:hypothetical protein [Candidatus Eremiobacteraeota bacterium]